VIAHRATATVGASVPIRVILATASPSFGGRSCFSLRGESFDLLSYIPERLTVIERTERMGH
jgi:hypothetical protein